MSALSPQFSTKLMPAEVVVVIPFFVSTRKSPALLLLVLLFALVEALLLLCDFDFPALLFALLLLAPITPKRSSVVKFCSFTLFDNPKTEIRRSPSKKLRLPPALYLSNDRSD